MSRPPLVPVHSIQGPVPARHCAADDDDDDGFWSDDSLQKDRAVATKPLSRSELHNRESQKERDELIASYIGESDPRHMGSADNMTCVSALTMDTEAGSFETGGSLVAESNSTNKKRRKKKREVWKMQPIPVKPYVPVPESSKDIRG